jgi:hypothetical protein
VELSATMQSLEETDIEPDTNIVILLPA